MPSNYKSPFATSFKSAIKRGVPCSVAVNNIANRNNKTPKVVFESLFKAGLCFRQKFNGVWVYWACEGVKTNATNWKSCQTNMWQSFIDWCICSGVCTPEQLKNNCGSQVDFMNYCKKFFAKQFNGTVGGNKTKTTGRKRTSTSRKVRTTTSRGRTSSSHKVRGRRTTTRRYNRAA